MMYLRMLNRSIDSVGGFSVGAALGQPRLLVPIILTATFNRYEEVIVSARYISARYQGTVSTLEYKPLSTISMCWIWEDVHLDIAEDPDKRYVLQMEYASCGGHRDYAAAAAHAVGLLHLQSSRHCARRLDAAGELDSKRGNRC